MTAYWVARSKVNNPDGYKRYTDLVPDILKSMAGRPYLGAATIKLWKVLNILIVLL